MFIEQVSVVVRAIAQSFIQSDWVPSQTGTQSDRYPVGPGTQSDRVPSRTGHPVDQSRLELVHP
jgi:hypothetical protein